MLSMLGVHFAEYAFVPASSTRRGVLIAARQEEVRLSDVYLGCFSVTVKVTDDENSGGEMNSVWWLTSVYGPQGDGEKELFLEELEAVIISNLNC